MKRSPCVSVVLPCFNAEGSLSAAIDSIRRQTFLDWELIVVDDGSTDKSIEIARSAALMDERILVIPTAHGGIVEALALGCDAVRGEFIARMDADDIAAPARLNEQTDLMCRGDCLAICGTQVSMTGGRLGSGRIRYEEWINSLVSHDEIVGELFVECPIPHPTFMMRREAYNSVGGYKDLGWAEDYDLCMRMFVAGMRFGKVSSKLLNWTESSDRLSMTSSRYSFEKFRALKRHYLFQTYLSEGFGVGGVRFHQWGAGEVGKAWLREWEGRKPISVVDINSRKIGTKIHNTQVISPDELPRPGQTFIVIAVGAPNAREEIRAWFEPRGYKELRDYLFLS
jgi:glycosyltransferase involved in cell wall biosynthesis